MVFKMPNGMKHSSPIKNRHKPVTFVIGIVDHETINQHLISKLDRHGRKRCVSVRLRLGAGGTCGTLKPSSSFFYLLIDTSQSEKSLKIPIGRMAQITVNPTKSLS